jgi:hypothetical protein
VNVTPVTLWIPLLTMSSTIYPPTPLCQGTQLEPIANDIEGS